MYKRNQSYLNSPRSIWHPQSHGEHSLTSPPWHSQEGCPEWLLVGLFSVLDRRAHGEGGQPYPAEEARRGAGEQAGDSQPLTSLSSTLWHLPPQFLVCLNHLLSLESSFSNRDITNQPPDLSWIASLHVGQFHDAQIRLFEALKSIHVAVRRNPTYEKINVFMTT